MLQRTDFFTGLPRRYFGAILIDVPLHFKTWSPKGEGRSASRHYRVMSFEESLTLPVGELAADDAWLFSWLPAPFIPRIGEQMEAWDFEYSSKGFCWAKLNKRQSNTLHGGRAHHTQRQRRLFPWPARITAAQFRGCARADHRTGARALAQAG